MNQSNITLDRRFNLRIAGVQLEEVERVCLIVGVSPCDFVRRGLDRLLHEQQLNEMFPYHSGSIAR